MTDAYRSYVIRVRRRSDDPAGIRLELEDLLEGGRAALHGPQALALADMLRALVEGATRERVAPAREAAIPIARAGS